MRTVVRIVPLVVALFACPASLAAAPWELEAPLSAAPAEIRAASAAIPVEPGTAVLGLFDGFELTFEGDGRATRIYRSTYRVETSADGWDSVRAAWSPWRQARPEIRARVIDKDGAEHVLDPATLGEYSSEDGDGLVYGDNRLLSAPLPNLGPGAVVEIAIAIRDTSPFFAAGEVITFPVGLTAPNLQTRIIVDAPESLPVRSVVRGLAGVEPAVQVAGGRRRTRFEIGSTPAAEPAERNRPPDAPARPMFFASTAASWNAVARAYAEIVDQQLREGDLTTQVKALLGDARTRDGKVARLLAALHEKVRYTGVEFGDAAITPRPPTEVLARGYGDCKDKAALLVAMLRAADIPAHVALLVAGPGRDIDADLPGLGVFDHAIVHVPGADALWIDATAKFARVGQIPLADQGRRALVAAPGTTDLALVAETTSSANTELETRAVQLAESGPGRVFETTDATGSIEMGYRAEFDGAEEKATRESLETYVRSAYNAKTLGAFSHGRATDLATPFRLELEALECGVVRTARTDAAVNVNVWNLLRRLRAAIDFADDEKTAKPRRSDLYFFEPHRVTWRWLVTPPPGYASASLPESGESRLGPASLTSAYERRADGVVVATFTVDSGPRRWTAANVEAARAAIRKIGESRPLMLVFEQVGEAHLAAGRIAEALAEFRRLAAAAPNSASPLARLSRALLEAGVGDAARDAARRAIAVQPQSAVAHQALAWVLQHDAVGRRFGKGWDRAGALAAYRQSRALDSTDAITRADLAILLEHDETGDRYGAGAELDQAIAEYRSLRDELDEKGFDQNLLVDLGRAGRYAETREFAESLAPSNARTGWLLAAVAGERGAAAAIAEAARVAPNAADRTNALLAAGDLLASLRQYQAAAALLAEGAKGAENPLQVRSRADALARTRRHEETPLDDTDPKSVVTRLVRLGLGGHLRMESFAPLFSAALRREIEKVGEEGLDQLFQDAQGALRPALRQSGLSPDVVADVFPSVVQMAAEGDDARGYRVRLDAPGRQGRDPFTVYVVRETDGYRIAGMDDPPSTAAPEILQKLDDGDLVGARQLLDWIRESHTPAGGDDPLGGHPFPMFWTKGESGDADRIRAAAACLLIDVEEDQRVVPMLEEFRKKAPESDRGRFDWALVRALSARNDHAVAETVARRLLTANPHSDFALAMLVRPLALQEKWDAAAAVVDERLAAAPDDGAALRLKGDVYFMRGRFAEQERILKEFVRRGQATSVDYNDLAWVRLVQGLSDAETIEDARKSVLMDPRPAFRHTLACALAEANQLTEAREIALNLMDDRGADEPNSNEWFVFGRIAEQYGERDSALAYYRRVKQDKGRLPQETSFGLAQKRLAALEQTKKKR